MPEVKSRTNSLIALFVVLATLLVVLTAFVNQQRIIDYVRGWQYEPSRAVLTLRERLDLTPEGEFYFNASHTSLKPASEFNKRCQQDKETNNPILGCYVAQEIFVFDADSQKLEGIEETTAAHELLHAVYERTGEAEKRKLHAELKRVYERIKTSELAERMEYYEKTEPGQRMNELYAIIGSEQAHVGTMLERHYAKYFKNRARIVAFHDSYNSVFTSATKKLKSLENQVNADVQRINQRILTYNSDIDELESDAEAFQARNSRGDFTTQAEFDRVRAELLARQAELDAQRNAINKAIKNVRLLRSEYSALVKEYNQLSQSINSSLTPIPALQ